MEKLVLSKNYRVENYKSFDADFSYLDMKKQNQLMRNFYVISLSYNINNYLPYVDNIDKLDEGFKRLENLWIDDCKFKNECKVNFSPVRSSGNLFCKYMIVGLNPGYGEYLQTGDWGSFFSGNGPSTVTLRKALDKLGILKECFFSNLVRCATTNNSKPDENAVNNCYNNWLVHEIEILKPDKIFVLGNDCFNYISKYRDDVIKLKHPAYHLRKGLQEEYHKEFEKYL